MHSALYVGWVRHRRFTPKNHDFRYRVFMVYADLGEIDSLCNRSFLWSAKPWAPARFRREDFLGDPRLTLDEAVRRRVAGETGTRPTGPIRMLANWRYFGYNVNPITVYYIFDAAARFVETLVLEVNNTPWNERHAYVLPVDSRRHTQRASFAKALHVSPFMPMDVSYRWHGTTPAQTLVAHIDNCRGDTRVFDATMRLERRDISARSLALVLIQFPLMTVKVIAAIYWQALKLWVKGTPLFGHAAVDGRKSDSVQHNKRDTTHEIY